MVEEKEELQTDENTDKTGKTGDDDSQKGGETKETKPEDVNWQQRHKDLQAEHTRKSQALAEAEARIEQLEQPPEEPDEDVDLGDDEYVDRKTAEKIADARVARAINKVRTQSANAYFRRTYPEFSNDDDAIGGILQNPKYHKELEKCASGEERIDFAVKKFQERLEKASVEAKTEAEAEAKEKEEAKRKASGLGSTTTSTPPKGDEDISDEQEIANRKAQSAKRRSLV